MEFTDEERRMFRETKLIADLPDGSYIGNLSLVRTRLLKGDKKLFLTYEISTPKKFENEIYIHHSFLTKNISFVKKAISKFGINPEMIELDHVENELRKKIGSEVSFTISTTQGNNGQQYKNCNIESVNTNTLEEWKQQHKQSQQQTELEEDLTF